MSYLGNIQDKSQPYDAFNNIILKEAHRNAGVPGILFFFKKYGIYPCTVEPYFDDNAYISSSLALKVLKEKYNHDTKNDIISRYHSNKTNFRYIASQLCDLGNGVMLHFSNGQLMENLECEVKIDYAIEKRYHIFYSLKIYHLPEKEEFAENLMKDIMEFPMKNISEASLQMICKSQHGFYLTPIKIKKPLISDLKLHYGSEFAQLHETIFKALKTEGSNGLILLHGLPGTGKTHYIRYLIQGISEKQIIYIPPDMTNSISTPEFFPFMLQNKDSILVIEDAENIIKSRAEQGSTTQSVANLLNLSDGLLGDSLQMPIIATFNCELNTIDSALLRKGRLIAQHEFDKLDVENAQKLSDHLGFTTKITEKLTLAEIYGQQKDEVK